MGTLNLVLLAIGAALTASGYVRAREPWARYKALKEQAANIARYESWRGGLRDSGPTGASVAMEMARSQARQGWVIAGIGVALAIAGLLIP